MTRACTRAARLLAIRDLFDAGARLSARELASRVGTSHRTALRDLADLQAEPLYYPLVMEGWRYCHMRRSHVPDTR